MVLIVYHFLIMGIRTLSIQFSLQQVTFLLRLILRLFAHHIQLVTIINPIVAPPSLIRTEECGICVNSIVYIIIIVIIVIISNAVALLSRIDLD